MSSFTWPPCSNMQTADRVFEQEAMTTGAARQARPAGPGSAQVRLLEVGADVAELARGVLAHEGDGDDADDRDQGHQQGVLDEAGAVLVPAQAVPQVRSDEVLPVADQVHRTSPGVVESPSELISIGR